MGSVTCGKKWVRERDMSRGEWESVTCGEECARGVITCDEHLYVGDHPDTFVEKKHGLEKSNSSTQKSDL